MTKTALDVLVTVWQMAEWCGDTWVGHCFSSQRCPRVSTHQPTRSNSEGRFCKQLLTCSFCEIPLAYNRIIVLKTIATHTQNVWLPIWLMTISYNLLTCGDFHLCVRVHRQGKMIAPMQCSCNCSQHALSPTADSSGFRQAAEGCPSVVFTS